MPDSTRDTIVTAIKARHLRLEDQISALMATDIVSRIPDGEWEAMHAVICMTCESPEGRLYPGGAFCDTHKPCIPPRN